MHTFKEKYSSHELEEIAEWFTARMDKLPSDMVLNEFTKTTDLKKTVTVLIALTKRPFIDVCFSGYIAHLFLIREKLIDMGIE